MKRILPVIVISQLFCTSLWFAGNVALEGIMLTKKLDTSFLAHSFSAVQIGFIVGTLFFAIFSVSDRFAATKVFFICSIVAALCNLSMCLSTISDVGILSSRFFTGIFLAGIYPVGMKIASDHYQAGLGKALGYIVGALVLGTACPYFLKTYLSTSPWQYIIYATSLLAILGGLLMLVLVPEGSFSKPLQKFDPKSFLSGFKNPDFRSAAFGYFGHMWELYAFWAFLPRILNGFLAQHKHILSHSSLWIFAIIASGSVACVLSGRLSEIFGSKKTATFALSLSMLCCLISPFILAQSSLWLLLGFLIFWAMVVIVDSPLFSTLVAQYAPPQAKGSSLTIVNCLGFSITILSIEFLNYISAFISPAYVYMFLAIGPGLGLYSLWKKG